MVDTPTKNENSNSMREWVSRFWPKLFNFSLENDYKLRLFQLITPTFKYKKFSVSTPQTPIPTRNLITPSKILFVNQVFFRSTVNNSRLFMRNAKYSITTYNLTLCPVPMLWQYKILCGQPQMVFLSRKSLSDLMTW